MANPPFNVDEIDADKVKTDPRNVYRKVTRKIYDFSPEQEQNLLAIVWLYRGNADKYHDLVSRYCRQTLDEGERCFSAKDEKGRPTHYRTSPPR